MGAQMALPADHPMMVAWNAFCETDEFKNALEWSVRTEYADGRPINDIQREQHAKGSLWLAFTKGMDARTITDAQCDELLRRLDDECDGAVLIYDEDAERARQIIRDVMEGGK
jgi:hypothetical protein